MPSDPNRPLKPSNQATARDFPPNHRHACQWHSTTTTIATYSGRFLFQVPKTPSYCA